jgi:hypothetical protein
MYNASHLLSSTGIRYKDDRGRHETKWTQCPPNRGRLNPNVIKERSNLVFQLVPQLKNLVIINSNLSDFEMIESCVEVADKYAENIMVIPPLLTRLTYAMEDLAQYHNPPKNEVILIVTITEAFVDFVILQRNQNFELNIVFHVLFKQLNECMRVFPQIYEDYLPHATCILFEHNCYSLANELQHRYQPENCFLKIIQKMGSRTSLWWIISSYGR